MNKITISDQYSFEAKHESNSLRLVVFENGEELACRKVAFREFEQFLKKDTGHLFKGRLQLDKSGDDILVSVKNNKAGTIRAADLAQLINAQSFVVL